MAGADQKLTVEYKPVTALIPYARNARTHSDEQVAQIAASIREFGFTSPISAPTQRGVVPSLVVLPFQNMSGDADQEYFADGIVEDLTTALSSFSTFAVISRNSAFLYKGRPIDVRQVARDLGVSYALEGSIR